MPDYYASTAGNDANGGTSWADAERNFAAAVAAAGTSGGNRIFLNSGYTEGTIPAAATTYSFSTNPAAPDLVQAADSASGTPPATEAASNAKIQTTSNSAISIDGNVVLRKLDIAAGSGGSNFTGILLGATSSAQHAIRVVGGKIEIAGTHANPAITLGPASGAGSRTSMIELLNCPLKFANSAQGIKLRACNAVLQGNSIDAAGSIPAVLLTGVVGTQSDIWLTGNDWSALNTTGNYLLDGTSQNAFNYVFNSDRLHANTQIVSGAIAAPGGVRVILNNCDAVDAGGSGAIRNRSETYQYAGTTYHDTGVARNNSLGRPINGAVQKYSIRYVAAGAQCNHLRALDRCGLPLASFNSSLTSQTRTLHILHFGSAALTSREVELAIGYMADAGSPKWSFSDSRISPLASGSALSDDSSEGWDANASAWQASSAYVVGAVVRKTVGDGTVFRAESVSGNSGSTEPAWPASEGGTVVDGGVTWRRCTRQKIALTFTAAEQGGLAAYARLLSNKSIYVCPVVD